MTIEKNIGKLSQGCELCKEGKKLVLFITGICPRKCNYCPLSKEKKNNDIINANELKTTKIKEIIKETKLSCAEGAGITGGDPLAKLKRTTKFIKKLKKEFGKNFHIHLYTSLELINTDSIKKLQKVGLDELRIHPDISNKKLWPKIKFLKNKFGEVGIEIPAFPKKEKEIIELINYSKEFVNFYNLNELEYATLYEEEYKKNNWKVNSDYSVAGSKKTALNIINHFKKENLRMHFCSSEFKDKVQFGERIKRRAKNVALKTDIITDEGMLLRGVIKGEIKNLKKIQKKLKNDYESFLDKKKNRLVMYVEDVKELSNKIKNCYIIEEYPTIDSLEVYSEKLS